MGASELYHATPVFPDMYVSKTREMRHKKKRWVVRKERKGIYLATSSEQAKKNTLLPSGQKLLKAKD